MEELQRGRGAMPRPSFVDPDGLTPLQAARQRELVGNAQTLYSTLSARRQQQLAETIGMMSPAIFPERSEPARLSSIGLRRSVDGHLQPLPRTPGTPDIAGRVSPFRMSTPSPAFLSFRATDEDIVDQARLHVARIKDLEAELKASRMETERALNNQAEIQLRSDRLSAAYHAERATRAAERIADAAYEAQQDRVDALSKAAVAQERRAAAMHKNVGLRKQVAGVLSASPEPLEAELRRYHGADSWMEEDDAQDDFAYRPGGWKLHYPQKRENRGEPLAESRQHAEDFLMAHPRYDQQLTVADLIAARVFTLETSRYRERLNLACRQMADWRYIDSDVDNPPPQFAQMYFHLVRAVTALKGAKHEGRLYRLEPGFSDLLEDAACQVGKMVTWHEFKTVKNLTGPAEALLLATSSGGDDTTHSHHNHSVSRDVLYRIEPSAECGHHFGDLGAYLCTQDPLSISARTDPVALTELLLPPGACFRVKKRATEGRVEVVVMEYIGMWADTFPTVGGEGYATMTQVENDALDARAEYEEARSKCDKLRRGWEMAYEEWQDAVAALRKIGGSPPVDEQTEQSEALDVARAILRERPEPEPEPEPQPQPQPQPQSQPQPQPQPEESGKVQVATKRKKSLRATSSVRQHDDEDDATTQMQKVTRGRMVRLDMSAAEIEMDVRTESAEGSGSQQHTSEKRGVISKRSQQLNAKSTFEPDGSGRVWRNTDKERTILYLTHK